MSKKAAAAATPAAGGAALACGNAACGKALAPPLLQCSKCKGEAYCCKACQVGEPTRAPPLRTARRTRLFAHPRPLPSPLPAPPRHQIAAWKAGHKHKCGAPGQGAAAAQLRRAAQGGAQLEAARAPAGLTAQQRRLTMRLFELQDADDWLGVVALERDHALPVAHSLQLEQPRLQAPLLRGQPRRRARGLRKRGPCPRGAPQLRRRRALPLRAALVLVPGLPRGNLAAGGTGRGKGCGCG